MRISFVILLMLVSSLLPLSAQDLDESYTFDNGVTFAYPTDGAVQVDKALADLIVVTLPDESELLIANTPFILEESGLAEDATPVDVMFWWVDFLFEGELEVTEDDFETALVGNIEALAYSYAGGEDQAGLALVLSLSDATFVAMDGLGPINAIEDLTLAIAESFEADSIDNGGAEACSISTTSANTVQLRVGPGTNRTVYAFMPANVDFPPLGSAEADDGSTWFQLDKATAAPNAAAAEAWVAAEAVDTEGDCANVGEAAAPPIIPIVPQAPPPANNDAGDDSGNSESNQSSGGPVSAIPGLWTINYAATGKASCLDVQGTVDFSPGWTPDVVNLSVRGSTVIMDGNRFNQIQPGVFSGIFTLANGNSLQFIIRPVSSTQFTGEALLTGVISGRTCSNTVPLSITRN